MIEPLIKLSKKIVDDRAEILDFMDHLKESMTNIRTAEEVHGIVKRNMRRQLES